MMQANPAGHGVGSQNCGMRAVGVGVAVAVGGGVGRVQAISQQIIGDDRHSHVPQQHAQVVPGGHSGASGLHSPPAAGVGVGVGVGVVITQGIAQQGA